MDTVVKKSHFQDKIIKKVLSLDTSALKTLDNTVCNVKPSEKLYRKMKNSSHKPANVANCEVKNAIKNIVNPVDSANFIFELPQKIYNVIKMSLINVELPQVINNISKKLNNNNFYINDTLITIPDGSYDLESLCCTINKIIDEKDLAGEVYFCCGGKDKYECRCVNNISVFVAAHSQVKFFQTGCSSNYGFSASLGWMMGFRTENVPIVPLNEDVDITAEAMPELDIKYAYMIVDDFNRNNNDTYSTTVNRQSNILAKISLKRDKDLDIYEIRETMFDNIVRHRDYFSAIDLEKLQIQFIDRFERVMDFGNNSVNCCLDFDCIYS